ncbi:MAG TPA: SUMF1/EgtB/PvdO family nonheme iron enzyme [Gammaproteobacteria bacterium]
MDLVFEIAGDQIDGARDYQEDAFLTTYLDDDSGGDSKSSALVVMADGMGGHAAGNIASNLVVSTFNKNFTGNFGKEDPPNVLREALDKANGALTESIKETPALDGMGCTMVTAVFNKGKVYWLSVGDSHMYLIRDGELIKKNEDHSYGGYLDRMKAQGMDIEPEPGLSRNMLMSAMTGEDIAEIDCPNKGFQLLAGDRLIICSDGLDSLSAGTILQMSAWSQNSKECVAQLLKAVEDANKPRQDNTTVIVVDVADRAAAAISEPAPEPAPAPEPEPEPASEPEPEPAPTPAPAPAPAPAAAPPPAAVAADEPEKKGGKGMLIAIAAVVLLAVGGGAFFMLGGKDKAAPDAESVAQAEPEVTGEPEPKAEPEAKTEPEPEPQPQAEPQPEPQPAPVAKAEPEPAAAKEFRDALKSGGEGPVMVTIPAGTFQMGSGGHSVDADERPQHPVTVGAFASSKYEVTFEEYEKFAKSTGRKAPDNQFMDKDTHPVINVSWDDAYAYTQWLSKETGKKYRLPSEAEWEYAAGAGTTTTFWWGFKVGENNAHCFDCNTGLNPRQPTRVGRFKPNPFGLYDTAGNVMEWVHDCYHPDYNGAPENGGVWEGGDCSSRIARGGAYGNTSKSIRAQKRNKWRSNVGKDSVGIRVVREVE